MSFYGGNQNGGQPGAGQQQQMGRQQQNPGLQNVQQVLTPQLFNINVNPNQLHNFFNEHNSSQNTLQLNAAANASSILLQQQPQSFPVNLINDQLGVGVGQLISSATVTQSQMQGLPISMPSALNFPQTLQVHAQTPPPQQGQSQGQQSKQKVFTGTVTKTHDNFGFIDEEVFFQMGVVKGPILPKEGDRVLVEADFNASMPFKWNATRVQIVNMGGGLNSSLNNMSNMNPSPHNQSQHMGFNSGMQKQTSAPSQPNSARLHGGHSAQPVSIVSNPHSVYSGGTNNPRMRPPNVGPGPPVPPPVAPLISNQQRDPKRSMGMPLPPDPPNFTGNSSVSGMSSADRGREGERCRERERSRERPRERSRERSRERMRERSRERVRPRSRERSRERGRDRSREKAPRARSRSRDRIPRDRSPRDRSPERKTSGVARDRSRERVERNPRDRTSDVSQSVHRRSRSRERSRDRSVRPKEKSKIELPTLTEKLRDRERSRDQRDKEGGNKNSKDVGQKPPTSPSPAAKSNKEDSKSDSSKIKEKDRKPSERAKPVHPASSDRSKRSRSRESVRTEKAHSVSGRSRSRSSSPKRKSLRPPPRYAVELPKFSLDAKDISVKELQRRYPNLYIPSDFFLAKSTWMDTFPMFSPFELGHSVPVQIMRKGVVKIEVPDPEGLEDKFKDIPDILEPADASFIFKAKVMIPSMSSLETIYRKSCGVNEHGIEVPDNTQHIDRLISFIVGMKTSKHEVMALGGPWSPSLDGSNPQSENQTLINTAIRSVRALTGINLSGCKHWYRFMELYYKRSNCLETVVYFLPDVWSCLPGAKDWSTLKSMYKYALNGEKTDHSKKTETTAEADNADTGKTDSVSSGPGDLKREKDGLPNGSQNNGGPALTATVSTDQGSGSCIPETGADDGEADKSMTEDDSESMNCSGVLVIDEVGSPSRDDGGGEHQLKASNLSSNTVDENGEVLMEVTTEEQPEGLTADTHHDDVMVVEGELSKETPAEEDAGTALEANRSEETVLEPATRLNPKAMNVAQLRFELGRRNLSPKGLKSVLVTRLVKALKDEEMRETEIQGNQKEIVNTTEPASTVDNTVIAHVNSEEPVSSEDTPQTSGELDKIEGKKDGAVKADGDENCIRLVNPSSIFEDPDDDVSVDDGELKDDFDNTTNEFGFVANFPPDTFPVLKPGMKDEEIKMWERRYALPKNPRLLIFPSESAKGGNFDCISMTLGVLRDYRIIDKKEDNFEVSLFSEFFHEMLQRDFAFQIYKEIVIEAGKEEPAPQPEIKSNSDAAEPTTKKRKLSNNSAMSPASVPQGKKITDPYLLLSFIFFDVTRCGYITESDLEDLCNCIGIGLTRAQIRKVIQKVLHKGNLYYRKWTDRSEQSKVTLSIEETKTLAQGNNAYFPVFVLQDDKEFSSSKTNETEANVEAVIAQVDGKNVDVKKLMDDLDQHGRNLAVAGSSLNVMKNSLDESKSQVTELKKSNESLKEELTRTKEALKKAEHAEKSAKESVDIFRRASERYCERVKDLVKFPTIPSSSSSVTKEKTDTAAFTKDVSNNVTEH